MLRERRRRLKALGAPQGEAQATAEEFVRADSSIQYGVLAALSDVQDALKDRNRGALVNLVSRLKQTDAANGRWRARRDALALGGFGETHSPSSGGGFGGVEDTDTYLSGGSYPIT